MGVGGGTVVPALRGRGTGWEGKETEEWPGKWSAVSTALPPLVAAATVPAASHKCCMGHYRESVPSPLPPWWGGGGEGKSPAWGRVEEGWGNDGTDQTPRNRTCSSVFPCSSEPQQWLRQRWGEQREREREALKETAAVAQGAARDKGQGRGGFPIGEEGGSGLLGQRGGDSESPPVSHQRFANTCHFLLFSVSQHVSFSSPMGASN